MMSLGPVIFSSLYFIRLFIIFLFSLRNELDKFILILWGGTDVDVIVTVYRRITSRDDDFRFSVDTGYISSYWKI